MFYLPPSQSHPFSGQDHPQYLATNCENIKHQEYRCWCVNVMEGNLFTLIVIGLSEFESKGFSQNEMTSVKWENVGCYWYLLRDIYLKNQENFHLKPHVIVTSAHYFIVSLTRTLNHIFRLVKFLRQVINNWFNFYFVPTPTDVCIALHTQCFPSVCEKDFTGDSGGIRPHDLLTCAQELNQIISCLH